MNEILKQAVKHSFTYGMILSQPFVMETGDVYQFLINKEELTYGYNSEQVAALQLKLKDLSYYEDEVDGDFGILTEHALKNFQKEHDISVSGEADAETLFSILTAERREYLKKIEQLSDTVYPGLKSKDVSLLQEILDYFGYYTGEIDGIYGPLTAQAIEIVEKNHQITFNHNEPQRSLEKVYKDSEEKVSREKEKLKEEKTPDQKQKPKIVPTTQSPSKNIIKTAKSQIGTPYKWGGTSPNGFDCSGFIQYVFQTEDITIPRTVSDIWNYASVVDKPSVGDLVFFETYKPGPSHAGIYIGNERFIHAGESRGVEISEMANNYWKSKYLGAKTINP